MLRAILATQLRSLEDPAWGRHHATARSLAERSGDALTRAEVLQRGAEALPLRQRCLAFAEERGQLLWQAYAHHELAPAYAEFDQRDQALVHARAVRRLFERTRDARGRRTIERFAREWGLALDGDVQAGREASR